MVTTPNTIKEFSQTFSKFFFSRPYIDLTAAVIVIQEKGIKVQRISFSLGGWMSLFDTMKPDDAITSKPDGWYFHALPITKDQQQTAAFIVFGKRCTS